jgi:hypothetical protein
MEKGGVAQMLLVAGIVVVVIVLWQKRQATAAALAVQPTGYAAVVNTVNSVSESVISKVPYLGDAVLNPLITEPVDQLLNADYEDFAVSTITGGLSNVTKYLDPRTYKFW